MGDQSWGSVPGDQHDPALDAARGESVVRRGGLGVAAEDGAQRRASSELIREYALAPAMIIRGLSFRAISLTSS